MYFRCVSFKLDPIATTWRKWCLKLVSWDTLIHPGNHSSLILKGHCPKIFNLWKNLGRIWTIWSKSRLKILVTVSFALLFDVTEADFARFHGNYGFNQHWYFQGFKFRFQNPNSDLSNRTKFKIEYSYLFTAYCSSFPYSAADVQYILHCPKSIWQFHV
jgi:hypothetical protein